MQRDQKLTQRFMVNNFEKGSMQHRYDNSDMPEAVHVVAADL